VETAAEAMLAGGARILQFRHKGSFTRELFRQAESVAAMCREHGATFLIDDRADIATILDAGLHVGQDDVPVHIARRLIGPTRMLGFSTHSPEQLAAAADQPIDYVALGPIYGTVSKDRPDPVVGLDGLRAARTTHPLVAIGGITRANAVETLAAGAASVAVIGDVFPESCTFDSIRERIEEWLDLLSK
jgi:thiamine-phosphate pyrophosphorylase